ncbi:MAG: Gfo/Idh/MocA family oxidoreductase [Defluviitaleaceae bacterium]|nr:Gfo/Idh/MocA family oxidoreductase [Defluviitaleaceae bacterium]MCL2238437.1 Gfo/Idh/MocA family oxidoreductase [Defluviitaleaceae bacterium]
MVRILMLSKWHVHAEGYAKFIAAQPDAEITCVWDEDPVRGANWAKDMGVAFEADLYKAVGREDVDAVVVDAPTTAHREVIVAAAKAGKHIFTEKALAVTLEECEAIAHAVTESGVTFCISYPHLCNPLYLLCKQLIDHKQLGAIHYLRFRNAHNGTLGGWLPPHWYDMEKSGGGAMMDLGCHPLYVAAYLLGKPGRVASVFNTTLAPAGDDNAVSVVEFENKAIAVVETSFISPFDAGCFELLGTEGAVISMGTDIKIRTKGNNQAWRAPDALPEKLPDPLRMWLDGITRGTPILFDINMALALTQLLENAYRSDETQEIVTIKK